MIVYRPVAAQYKISSPYGFRQDPVDQTEGVFHYGIDFAVPVGTPVVAAIGGKIFKAGYQDAGNPEVGFGLRVWQTAQIEGKPVAVYYAHLSELSVNEGDILAAGQRVGLSGNTGKSSGPHLHFEVRQGGKGLPISFV